mgnify:CR=1 FL=1
MVMKFLVLSIYLSIFCNPLQAKIRESGIVFGDGFAFSLTAPSGWVLDNHSGNSEGLQAVFYPKGSSWDKSETVMYANIALKKIKGNESVKKVISFDKKKFKIRSAKTRILDGKNILLSNKKQAIVKTMACITSKSERWIDCHAKRPRPFNVNTDSITTEPPNMKPSCAADNDTTGMIALRNACLNSTTYVFSPLARAVRI